MLDILEDYLIWRGHEYRRLDGNTPYEDRANNIDEFNAENSQIFVYAISTRAGGLGKFFFRHATMDFSPFFSPSLIARH